MGFMVIKNFDPLNCGMPDRLIILPGGRTVWVEVKSHGKLPNKMQVRKMRELVGLGHKVFVCDGVEELYRILTYIKMYQVASNE